MDIQKQIDELRREIEHHNKLYYVDDAPVISDFDYDMLMQRGGPFNIQLSGGAPRACDP